jgi:hypothetical protein
MAPHRTMFRCWPASFIAAATLLSATVPGRDARADEVSPTAKGVVGGALLGAEVVTIVEGIADVRSGWAYGIGALVGAAGGGIGGYFVEQNSSNGRVPTYMLAGGLALIIPAVVLTLNGTRYRPQEGASEDNVPRGAPAEPGTPGGGIVSPGGSPRPGAPARTPPGASTAPPSNTPSPPSLVGVREDGAVSVGVPVPDVRPVFSLVEQRQYGMQAQTELRLPVLHIAF